MSARRLLQCLMTLVFLLLGVAPALQAQGGMTFSTANNQTVTNPVFHYDVYVCSYGIVQTQWGEHQHDYGTASVEIGGTSAANCNWDEYQVGWSGNLALIPGINNFTVYAYDGYGIYGAMLTVTLDAPPLPNVTVGPDTITNKWTPPVGTVTQPFKLVNVLPLQRTFTLAVTCTGSVSCGMSQPSSVQFSAPDSATVLVSYSVSGATGATGTLKLRATDNAIAGNKDSATTSFRVGPTSVATDPSLCLALPAGRGAGYECGALRMAHAMPAVNTVNQQRAPVLMYNSQQANPRPIVSIAATVPSGTPTTVETKVTINGQTHTRNVPGSQFPAGQARRAMVSFDASGYATGLYDYTIEVRQFYSGGNSVIATGSGSLPIVNRASSPFGSGWWVAGLEELYSVSSGRFLWVGGDGSTRVYEPMDSTGTHVYYAAKAMSYVDSLVRHKTDTTFAYTRRVPSGGSVIFSASLKHRWTRNRLGDSTVFIYASNRLSEVKVPPVAAGLLYTFKYTGAGKLDTILSPDTISGSKRKTKVTVDGSGQLTQIQDPGVAAVVFAYGGVVGRVSSRTDRRGGVTAFSYDSAHRLDTARVKITTSSWSVTKFCAGESMGMTACQNAVVDPATVRTIVDGARTDVADTMQIWIDGSGAPTKIRDAFGDTTLVTRGDPRFPALVTRIRMSDSQRFISTYDDRGNLAQSIDSGKTGNIYVSPTRYEWDAKWNLPTLVVKPDASYERFLYSASTGNLVYREDSRGVASRDSLLYDADNLLRVVVHPGGARDSIYYDSFLRNVSRTVSPLKRVSRIVRDSLGRVRKARTMLNDATDLSTDEETAYDAAGRGTWSSSWAPAYNNTPQQRLTISRTLDDEGNVLTVARTPQTTASPMPFGSESYSLNTYFRFDTAGRQVLQYHAGQDSVKSFYHLAGMDTMRVTPRGDTIFTTYDALGRATRVIEASVRADTFRLGASALGTWNAQNPAYGGNAPYTNANLRDTSNFEYDNRGRLKKAVNRYARVGRTYDTFGNLENDTLAIRHWSLAGENVHLVRYDYDYLGRVTRMHYPAALVAGTTGQVNYSYGTNGPLNILTALNGSVFSMNYNGKNELTSMSLPGSIIDTMKYDADGLLTFRAIKNNTPTSVEDYSTTPWLDSSTFTYEARGKLATRKNAVGLKDTVTASYGGLGRLFTHKHVVKTGGVAANGWVGTVDEGFNTDPMGNNRGALELHNFSLPAQGFLGAPGWNSSGSYRSLTVDTMTGRVTRQMLEKSRQLFYFDDAGNTTLTSLNADTTVATRIDDRISYYDASGRIRESERRILISQDQTWDGSHLHRVTETYRYDPLGRRILVRTRNSCTNQPTPRPADCDFAQIRRTVWAGDREIVEIQRPDSGYQGTTAATRDSDTSTVSLARVAPTGIPAFDPNPQFGRVAYSHGFGIDRPFAITRFQYADRPTTNASSHFQWPTFTLVPHWDHRGEASGGLHSNGAWKRDTTVSGTSERVIAVQWSTSASAYARLMRSSLAGWQGTLITQKIDGVGTMYRRHRSYDPMTGRFTQPDPIGFAGGPNQYNYAAGDPLNLGDPFGMFSCPHGYEQRFTDDDRPFCFNPRTNDIQDDNFHYNARAEINLARRQAACDRAVNEALKSYAGDLGLSLGLTLKEPIYLWAAVALFVIGKDGEPLRNYIPGYQTGTKINEVWETCMG